MVFLQFFFLCKGTFFLLKMKLYLLDFVLLPLKNSLCDFICSV